MLTRWQKEFLERASEVFKQGQTDAEKALKKRGRRMIIYHGSYMPILKPEIRKARFSKDFGTGFYCTEILEQAKRWARRFDTPITSHYEYEEAHGLDILRFPEMTEEWLDFIVACRRGSEHSHDIVIGAMANDQIFNYVDDFIAGILNREQFWVLAKFKHPTHQIAFCTIRALNTITWLKSEGVQS